MTSDVPPMEPCPVEKRGRHHFGVVIPGTDDGDMTLYCEMCGAMRRVPATGTIGVPLDDLPAGAILGAAQRALDG